MGTSHERLPLVGPLIVCREYLKEASRCMIQAGLYIAFDEPVRCRPLSSDLLQCCMATAVWPESVTGILEVRSIRAIVDRFEDHVHDLLYDLIPCGRDAEFP